MTNDLSELPLFQYTPTDFEQPVPPPSAEGDNSHEPDPEPEPKVEQGFPFKVGDWVWVAPFLGQTVDAQPKKDGYAGRKRWGETKDGHFTPAPRKLGKWTTNHFVPRRLLGDFGSELAQIDDLGMLPAGIVFVTYPSIKGMDRYGVSLRRIFHPNDRPRSRRPFTQSYFCEFHPPSATRRCWVECRYFERTQSWASATYSIEPRELTRPNAVYFHISWLTGPDESISLPDGSFTLTDYHRQPDKYLSPRGE